MKAVSVSVIIPTRGRDESLRQTLRDLSKQDYSQFDIWVVDQNDKSLVNLKAECESVVLHHETMPPLGSHAGRNYAISRTTAALCVFIDDDVRVPIGFLSSHVVAIESAEKDVAVIAGRVVQPNDNLTEEDMRKMGQPARYNRWTGRVSGNFVGLESAIVDHLHECNFSIRTDVLKKINGFNEEFKGNAYFEGTDLALRVIDLGYKIFYSPDIALIHLQDRAGGNRVNDKARHTYWFMRNLSLLNSLHMNRIGLPVFGAYGLAYVMGKAIKNADVHIARQGLTGLVDGLKYFLHHKKSR